MTTERDGSTSQPFQMLECPERLTKHYPTLVLALRDMREANGRDLVSGAGRATGPGSGSLWG